MLPKQGVVWITRNEKGWLQALDNDDKLIAKGPDMPQLEKSLNALYSADFEIIWGKATIHEEISLQRSRPWVGTSCYGHTDPGSG
jgi:hypothetical protein